MNRHRLQDGGNEKNHRPETAADGLQVAS